MQQSAWPGNRNNREGERGNMIFRFLRQYLHDPDFERSQADLAEAKILLTEYKQFIEEERKRSAEAVDPDYLLFIWASIGFAFAAVVTAAKVIGDPSVAGTVDYYVYWAWGLFAFLYGIANSVVVVILTRKYSATKSDREYLVHFWLTTIGVAALIIGFFILAYFKRP
jgi:general stress protein CsbA